MTPPEKTTRPTRATQAEIAYWMGQVDSKLEALFEKMAQVVRRLDDIERRQDEHVKESQDEQSEAQKKNQSG
jgi:transcription initiation factor IIE alpha subunit